MAEDIPEVAPEEAVTPVEDVSVTWHGVLAPEGIASGDGREFAPGSLTTRVLPLPLTWQKSSADGHSGSVTVAKIDRIVRVEGEMRASGSFISNVESDEVVGLLAEFGRFGVSVDADDVAFEMNEEEEKVVFTKARIASASIVAIPAFAQAWVSLGEPPEGFFPDEADDIEQEEGESEEELVASHVFVDVAPGKTEDGPGWLTHPVDTDRLRDYWVRGPGAAKINWGTPGDFNRCRLNVAEYIKPQYLNGYCANRHYDALGFWPGRPVAGEVETFAGGAEGQASEAVTLVASGGWCAPSEWFDDPKFEQETHFTVTEEGRVFGHIASWTACHSSYMNECVLAPHSKTDYAYFATGQVLTTDGMRNTGPITIGGPHARHGMRLRPAMAHYENTCVAVADVSVGEDKFGIWCAGWIRPGTTDEQVAALRASDVSGDWRYAPNGNMEMIAALAVNAGGFHTPRVAAGITSGQQISLVAAGFLGMDRDEHSDEQKAFAKLVADQVAKELSARTERKKRMAELAARVEEITSGV